MSIMFIMLHSVQYFVVILLVIFISGPNALLDVPVVTILSPKLEPGETPLVQDVEINLADLPTDLNNTVRACRRQKCLIISCQSNYPNEWLIQETADDLEAQSHAVEKKKVVPAHNVTPSVYTSNLILQNPKPEYTGWYICRNRKTTGMPHAEIPIETRHYIFMQDSAPRAEFAISRPKLIDKRKFKLVTATADGSEKFTIPCRPNNPNQELFLFYGGTEIGNRRSPFFDPKIGFNITAQLPRHGRLYECRVFDHPRVVTDFLIIRIISKPILQISPTTANVFVDERKSIVLSCVHPQVETQIIMASQGKQGPLDDVRINLGSSIEVADGGNYFCIVREPSFNNSTIHNVEILHKWIVRVVSPSTKLDPKLIGLQNERIGNVLCDSGNLNIRPKLLECPCTGALACKATLEVVQNAVKEHNCMNSKCDEILDGVTTCEHGWLNETQCRNATVEKSGFLMCVAGSKSDGAISKNKGYCNLVFMEVIAGIKDPSLASKPHQTKNRDCLKVGGDSLLGTAGKLWMNGRCELVSEESSTLTCSAHRSSFFDSLNWYWSFTSSNGTQEPSQFVNGTINQDGLTITLLETTTTSSELITSSLALISREDLAGTIWCNAYYVQNGLNEKVGIPIKIQAHITPKFIGGAKDGAENVEINYNDTGHLNCSVDTFPTPDWIWFKKIGETYQPINFDNLNPTPEFTNIKLTWLNDRLEFSSFTAEQQGNYRCTVSQSLLKDQPNVVLQKDFLVTLTPVADWLTILITIVVVLAVLGILAIGLACLYHYRYRIERVRVQALSDKEVYEFINGNVEAINEELDIAEQAHLLPYKSDFEFAKDRLKFDKQLGAGAFGTVMKATADGICKNEASTIVAVKTVQPNADILYFKTLLTELKIMIHIGKHMNVVCLLGAVTEDIKNREVFLIVEYCRYGNLQHYLHKNRKTFVDQVRDGKINPEIRSNADAKPSYYNVTVPGILDNSGDARVSMDYQNATAEFLTGTGGSTLNTDGSAQPLWRNNVQGDYLDMELEALNTSQLLCWCYQTASGMEYLTQRKVIHGDLAARNILLADNNIIKVADFGLARQVYKDSNYIKKQKCPLPAKWMAIESLRSLQFSSKSDVWAFGVVLWEMFTLGDNPYPGVSVDNDFLDKLQQGYRMKQPKYSSDEMYNMMVECWREDPDDRPSFETLCQVLGAMLKNTRKDYYQILLQQMENAKTMAETLDGTPEEVSENSTLLQQSSTNPVYVNEL